MISFKVFRERFGSRVTLWPGEMKIDTEYLDGPFKYMHSPTGISRRAEGGCEVRILRRFRVPQRRAAAASSASSSTRRCSASSSAFERPRGGALRRRRAATGLKRDSAASAKAAGRARVAARADLGAARARRSPRLRVPRRPALRGQPKQTRPSGLVSEPPGPAMPVIATATSRPTGRSAPSAISRATSSDTAPWAASVAAAHAQHRLLGGVGIGHEAAVEDVGRAGDVGDRRADHAAGAAFRRGDHAPARAGRGEKALGRASCVDQQPVRDAGGDDRRRTPPSSPARCRRASRPPHRRAGRPGRRAPASRCRTAGTAGTPRPSRARECPSGARPRTRTRPKRRRARSIGPPPRRSRLARGRCRAARGCSAVAQAAERDRRRAWRAGAAGKPPSPCSRSASGDRRAPRPMCPARGEVGRRRRRWRSVSRPHAPHQRGGGERRDALLAPGEAEPFGCRRLDADPVRLDPHDRPRVARCIASGMRADLRALAEQRHIGMADRKPRAARAPRRMRRKISRRRALPLRVRGREMAADVALGQRAVDRVGQRMHARRRRRNGPTAPRSCGIRDAAELTRSPGPKACTSKPLPVRMSMRALSMRSRPGEIAAAVVIFMLSSSPATMATSRPAARATATSSAAPPGWARCAARIAAKRKPCGVCARQSPSRGEARHRGRPRRARARR